MEVVLQSGGSLCICYQHPLKKRTQSQLHQDQSQNATGHNEETVDLSYSVLAVHHMKVLYGSALQVPWDMAVNTKLYFSSMGEMLKFFTFFASSDCELKVLRLHVFETYAHWWC